MNRHILLTGGLLLMAVLAFESTRVDVWIQDQLYRFDAQRWLLEDAGVQRWLFYEGIKQVYIGFVLLLIPVLFLIGKFPAKRKYRPGLWIVLLSTLLVPLAVNGLKAVTHVPCPRQLERYGGDYPYVTILSAYPDTFQQSGSARCYPAGHASGGFALLSLFFLFRSRPAKRVALVTALTLGWLTGGYKILVGDHFLSHTVVTMILSWLLILLIAKGVYALQRDGY